jgi:uncharacterized membrane protein
LALAFAVVLPPLQVSDEHGHFLRAYAISSGEFVARGTPELPPSIVDFVMRYPEAAGVSRKISLQELRSDLWAPTDSGAARRIALTNADGHHMYLAWAVIGSAAYCPLVYLPASLGILLARALHLAPLAMMYAARIFNVLTFVAALAFCFRLAPGYRAVTTAVALIPMTLHQAGGISGDLVTIAISFVGLSLVLHARERPVGGGFLTLVGVVFTLWSLCKFSIWAMPLLFLVPITAFASRRAWLAYICAVAVCMVGAVAIWNAVDSANVSAFSAARLTHGIDVPANLRLVSAHPLTFARQLAGRMRTDCKMELGQFAGEFGWTSLSLPQWVRASYLLLVLMVAIVEFSPKPFRFWERGVLLLVLLGGIVFVHAIIFISDGTLCSGDPSRLCFDQSNGVQGRYFLPICLAGLVALRQRWFNLPRATLLGLVTGFGALQALAALVLIGKFFYA